MEGAEVGELNGRIIGQQFKDLKLGDRFFYNHRRDSDKHVPGLGQRLRENVYKRTLSAIICDVSPVKEELRRNSPKVKVPSNAFTLTPYENWRQCGEVLDETSLNMEEIIDEIVEEDYFPELGN